MVSGEYESYYAVIRGIPEGRVMTYGDVAFHAGRPRQARRVGYALFALTDAEAPPKTPWWRVINARGEVSFRPGEDGRQRALLEAEGVYFDLEGRVDLARYRHAPERLPPDPDLPLR